METETLNGDAIRQQFSSRVNRGAKILDKFVPDWFRDIASDSLAMESCDKCVLGQLHGDYLAGYQSLRMLLPDGFMFSSAEHGFTLLAAEQRLDDEEIDLVRQNHDFCPERIKFRFNVLADLWRDEVRKRLEVGP